MNEFQSLSNYCVLDAKDDITQRYRYKCQKSPFAMITVRVCGVNENEAKTLAEEAMTELTSPPPGNTINIRCSD